MLGAWWLSFFGWLLLWTTACGIFWQTVCDIIRNPAQPQEFHCERKSFAHAHGIAMARSRQTRRICRAVRELTPGIQDHAVFAISNTEVFA